MQLCIVPFSFAKKEIAMSETDNELNSVEEMPTTPTEAAEEVSVQETEEACLPCEEEGSFPSPKKKNLLRRFLIVVLALLLLGLVALTLAPSFMAKYYYTMGMAQLGEGNYDDARQWLSTAHRYGDVSDAVKETYYRQAQDYFLAKEYSLARQLFEALDGYKDADDAAKRACYEEAVDLLTVNPQASISLLRELGDYEDSALRIKEANYYLGKLYEQAERYVEAIDLFTRAGDVWDAQVHIKQCWLWLALDAEADEDWLNAYAYYRSAGDHKSSYQHAKRIAYIYASEQSSQGHHYQAYEYFKLAGDYADSPERAGKSIYVLAMNAEFNEDYVLAYRLFSLGGNYDDCAKRATANMYRAARQLEFNQLDYEGAAYLYQRLGDYSYAPNRLQVLNTSYARYFKGNINQNNANGGEICEYDGRLLSLNTAGTALISTSITTGEYFVLVEANDLGGFNVKDGTVYFTDGQGVASVPADGGEVKRLFTGQAENLVLYNGNLYFTSVSDEDTHRICRMTSAGKNFRVLVSTQATCLNIQGGWIYYLDLAEGGAIYEVKVDGSSRRRLGDGTGTCLMLYGRDLYYCNENGLFRMDYNGKGQTRISELQVKRFIVFDGLLLMNVPEADGSFTVYRSVFDGSFVTKLSTGRVAGFYTAEGVFYYTLQNSDGSVSRYRSVSPETWYVRNLALGK